MTAVTPGRAQEPVQPALPGRAPARLDVQDVRARRGGREGDQPGDHELPLGAVLLPAGRPTATARRAGTWWCPETYDHSYTGWTSIEQATLRSDNTVYAQLTLDVTARGGRPRWREKLGVRSPLDVRDGAYVPSIGLGSIEVSPLDMASAYATLAAGGHLLGAAGDPEVVLANGKDDEQAGWGKPQAPARDLGRRRLRRDEDPRAEHPVRHRDRGRTSGIPRPGRPARRRSTPTPGSAGYTPRLQTTVWVGYPRGQDPDGERPRDLRLGRQLPGADLAALHGSAIGQLEPLELPRADRLAGVGRLRAGHDRPLVRLPAPTTATTPRTPRRAGRGPSESSEPEPEPATTATSTPPPTPTVAPTPRRRPAAADDGAAPAASTEPPPPLEP